MGNSLSLALCTSQVVTQAEQETMSTERKGTLGVLQGILRLLMIFLCISLSGVLEYADSILNVSTQYLNSVLVSVYNWVPSGQTRGPEKRNDRIVGWENKQTKKNNLRLIEVFFCFTEIMKMRRE